MNISDIDNLPEGGNETALPSDSDTGFNWDYCDPDEDQDSGETPVESATENEDVSDQGEAEELPEEFEASEHDQDGESEPEEGEETPEDVKPDVKVTLNDGSEVTLQELKDGYYRQSDYSRKTEETARIRDEYTEKEQQLSEGAQNVIQTLETIDEFMRSEIPALPPPELAQEDFMAYVQQKAVYDHAVNRMGRLQDAINAPKQVVENIDQQKLANYRRVENERLAEYFPEMANPAKRDQLRSTIKSAAEEVGISEQELRGIADHRFYRLAHWAAKGIKADKARKKARKKTENVPPVAQPKAQQRKAQATRNRDAMSRLAKTGSIHDAVQVDFD